MPPRWPTGRRASCTAPADYLLQSEDGQISRTHSLAPGLDYPGVGPEHAHLRDTGRASYVTATDAEALEALRTLARLEGIIPAIESAHAVAHTLRLAPGLATDDVILINLSGRGDKDMQVVGTASGTEC